MGNNAIPQVVTTPAKNYVNVKFSDVDAKNGYEPRNIQIPIGARFEGNTVIYEVTKKGELVKTNKADGTKENVTKIELTKPQLATIEEYANIDDNPNNLTPDELVNCYKDVSGNVAKTLKERGSEYKLIDDLYGASTGDEPTAGAEFIPVSQPRNGYDPETVKYIFVDLRNCK